MSSKYKYIATIPTGLEELAAAECKEKFSIESTKDQGKIIFETSHVCELLSLRGLDNLYIIISEKKLNNLPNNDQELKTVLNDIMVSCDWKSGLLVWQSCCGYTKCQVNEMLDQIKNNQKPSFRVTCNRKGEEHSFSSNQAASILGGLINDMYHWPVSMKLFDLEIVLNIKDDFWYACLTLTKQSLHRRNLVCFGATTLRSTICYNILRLAKIQMGDIVSDPMCGSAAISMESAHEWPFSINFASDIHFKALKISLENIQSSQIGIIQLVAADVTHLPYKNSSIDVFVTDLPFGKRMGNKKDNKVLYPMMLLELARCCTLSTGRAVLLTKDRRNINRSLEEDRGKKYWKRFKMINVNVGGLSVSLYGLNRTSKTFEQ